MDSDNEKKRTRPSWVIRKFREQLRHEPTNSNEIIVDYEEKQKKEIIDFYTWAIRALGNPVVTIVWKEKTPPKISNWCKNGF